MELNLIIGMINFLLIGFFPKQIAPSNFS